MNETLLRWQGRIGSLKGLAVLALIFLIIFLFPTVDGLLTAWRNPGASQTITVAQLVSGGIGPKQYVSVSGLASYELSYTETEDGITKAIIYPLIDRGAKTVVFVRTTKTSLSTAPDASVIVTGMTTRTPTDLQRVIEKDISEINSAGFQTSSALYIEEGKAPGSAGVYLLKLAAMAFAALLCLVTFFFPTTVFRPFPVPRVTPAAEVNRAVKASGQFRQVKTMQPLEFGKAKKKFVSSNANLFLLDDKTFGVHIHFIYIHRVYGIQVSRQESDWMILIKPSQILAIEPGKVYGWRDRWAVSFRYGDPAEKEQSVLITFENDAAQADFVNFLRDKGFPVSSGQYPVSGRVWA